MIRGKGRSFRFRPLLFLLSYVAVYVFVFTLEKILALKLPFLSQVYYFNSLFTSMSTFLSFTILAKPLKYLCSSQPSHLPHNTPNKWNSRFKPGNKTSWPSLSTLSNWPHQIHHQSKTVEKSAESVVPLCMPFIDYTTPSNSFQTHAGIKETGRRWTLHKGAERA